MEVMQKLGQVFLTSLGSVLFLFILTKIMGNKQISQLNMFDYINGITIGSIAAEMATALESDFLLPLLAMIIYAAVVLLISFISSKSIRVRRFVTGRSILLLDNGKMYRKNFKKCKLDMAEFLTQCRVNGYFDISQIQTAVFECNGDISIMPKADYRPVTPQDMALKLPMEKPAVILIQDGVVLFENLHYIGKDKQWLNTQLKKLGINKATDVFLASCENDKVTAFIKCEENAPGDIFM